MKKRIRRRRWLLKVVQWLRKFKVWVLSLLSPIEILQILFFIKANTFLAKLLFALAVVTTLVIIILAWIKGAGVIEQIP